MNPKAFLVLALACLSLACETKEATANVNVRTKPVTGTIVKVLSKGTKVCVESVEDGWAKTAEGYCSNSYLKSVPSTSATTSTTTTTPAATTETTPVSNDSCTKMECKSAARLRIGPSTSSKCLKTLDAGTIVCITSTKDGWSQTDEGNWISSSLLIVPIPKMGVSDIKFNYPEPTGSKLGTKLTLWATGYYTPIFENGSGDYALRDKEGKKLASIGHRSWCNCAMQGSCTISHGTSLTTYSYAGKVAGYPVNCSAYYKVSGYASCTARFYVSKGLFGNGAGSPVIPFRTVAVDKSLIALGSVIYIPQARGQSLTLPDGSTHTHDGYFLAADVGGAVKGNHIDVYFGNDDPLKSTVFKNFVKSKSSATFTAYKINDNTIKNELLNFSKNFLTPV